MDLLKVKESLKERAYRIIHKNIISCTWPPGSLLNEKELASTVAVSRTPVREALNRLEQENLVRIVSQRGVFVSEITVKTINDVYQVREILEPFIVRLVTPIIDVEELARFDQLFESCLTSDYDQLTSLDDEFHQMIIAACDNSYLIQMMNNIYAQNERIRILSTRLPCRMEETIAEHREIIAAMMIRDADKAAQAMQIHIAKSRYAAFRLSTGRSGSDYMSGARLSL
ncbi:hypothetical protein AXX12_06020 [Anaerosporomusa subterranea]|uniref:HTH gntR-type domain-containing protein n=1 Tax=Anaerosporomusa subterranea TaxID=1794912 RepID=A0A154BQ64_ANASB|nr:GntR family transcriptional regulator [Anaerosporomusa subterranea]KYZ75995.1 hypothetical protein AXX12_06020 [Anaerosporomusa subterranea]